MCVCVTCKYLCMYIHIYMRVCVYNIHVCYIHVQVERLLFLLVDSSFSYCLCVYHCLSMYYLICYMQNYTQLELYIYKYACMFFPNANFTNDNMP